MHFRTLSALCLIGVSTAIKIQAAKEVQAPEYAHANFKALNDLSNWSKTTKFGVESSELPYKWTDNVFPPNDVSNGFVDGDAADTANVAVGNSVAWKRLSEIYGDDTVMFAPKETQKKKRKQETETEIVISSVQQGSIGDCYMIASMVSFDSRPGAIEDLFLTKEVNQAGAYTVKFYMQGEPVYVTVDDYVPVKVRKGRADRPLYASSRIAGEIWPMIFEKAWAKLLGSYAATEGGNTMWTMLHMSNDPVVETQLRGEEFTETNDKGEDLWKNLLDWHKKEYLVFADTDGESWIQTHAFSMLNAVELTIAGKDVKMVKMRNPWKGDAEWDGDYSHVKGGEMRENLIEALEIEEGEFTFEDGQFWMSYSDFLIQFEHVVVAYSQKAMTTETQRDEHRPMVKLAPQADVQFVKVELTQDADVRDYFAILNHQGGNRIGTKRDPKFEPWNTVYFRYAMVPAVAEYDEKSFQAEWKGSGAHSSRWDRGYGGSQKMLTLDDNSNKKMIIRMGEPKDEPKIIPAGDYIIKIFAKWADKTNEYQNKILKDMNLMIASPSGVTVETMTSKKAIELASKGKASYNTRGACSRSDSRYLAPGKSLAEYADLTRAAGYKQFTTALTDTRYGVYMCKDGWTATLNGSRERYDIYDVLTPPVTVAALI